MHDRKPARLAMMPGHPGAPRLLDAVDRLGMCPVYRAGEQNEDQDGKGEPKLTHDRLAVLTFGTDLAPAQPKKSGRSIVSQAPYDLLLRGGHVIDPATGWDGTADIAIRDRRIAAVAQNLPGESREIIDVRGRIVLPGMIDTHAHVYTYVSGRFGLPADMVGVESGVTTLIDQGGPSCMTFPGFAKFIAEPAASRVLAFVSAYVVGGLEGHYYPNLYGPDGVDIAATVKTAKANPDLIRGIKAHAELGGVARWGFEVMKKAAEIGREADLPIYIHFGQLWDLPEDNGQGGGTNGVDADDILPEIVKLLRPGDILAHPFTRHPGGFIDKHGKLHPIPREAIDRGLKIDVGHGSHFSFRMARRALEAGIVPDTLGADMHGYNTRVPPPPVRRRRIPTTRRPIPSRARRASA